jgi:hypothetical protein
MAITTDHQEGTMVTSDRATVGPRAIGIVRVSQRKDDSGHSPEVQRRALDQMAELHGWSLALPDVLDENVDNGKVRTKSGGAELADRPRLLWAVEQIEAGQAHILAAENFDRLFRNLDVQRAVVKRIEAAGGEVWERSGRISHRRAAEKFAATIKGGAAEYVKDTAEERSWDAVEVAIAKGKIPWHQTAPGYLRNEDSTLRPDPELQPVVQRAFRLRADGATIAEVRAFLAGRGVARSYHGTQHLLRDRVYLGEIHFGTHTPNLHAHEPIVDPEVFEATQRMALPRGRKAKSDRLLARLGVLTCSGCGGSMVVGTQTQNGRRYPFYRCGKVREDCHDRQAIGAELVERYVTEYVRAAIQGIRGEASVATGVAACKRALDEAQGAFDSAVKALADFADEPAVVAKLRDLREQRDAARDRYEQAAATDEDARVIVTANEWDELTLDERRRLIQAVVERVEVRRGGRGVERLTVVPKGFNVQPIRQPIPAKLADQSTRNAPQGARR